MMVEEYTDAGTSLASGREEESEAVSMCCSEPEFILQEHSESRARGLEAPGLCEHFSIQF